MTLALDNVARRERTTPIAAGRRALMQFVIGAAIVLAFHGLASANSLKSGRAAFQRGAYVEAARLLQPLAEAGNAQAQTMMGFLYATGRGVPQNFVISSYWYGLGAENGDVTAQYLLGLAFDKGQGVPRDEIRAYIWLNLAAGQAPKPMRENLTRLRDAVASKMNRRQIAVGQWAATRWFLGAPE